MENLLTSFGNSIFIYLLYFYFSVIYQIQCIYKKVKYHIHTYNFYVILYLNLELKFQNGSLSFSNLTKKILQGYKHF